MHRAIALLALVVAACVPATQPVESVAPASVPAAQARDDLVYLAVQAGGTQGAAIVAMPSGRVLAHVEGYTYPYGPSSVGPRVALFTSSAATPDGASVRIARVELASGRAATLDLGARKMSGVTSPPLPAVAGTADGSRIIVAYTSVEDALARTHLELFDERGARLASRTWTELPDNAGPELSAWTRLVPLGADRFLLVRSLWRPGRTRETWSLLDPDLRELATRSSDLGWAQESRGPRPTTERDEDVLWSGWCDAQLLRLGGDRFATTCATRAHEWREKALVVLDASLAPLEWIPLPEYTQLGDYVGRGLRADGTIVLVTTRGVALVDPATRAIRWVGTHIPRSFELFPVALAKIPIWPMLQFSPDGRIAYVVTYERIHQHRGIGVVDTGTGRVVSELLVGRDVRGAHLSPDGTRLYALAGDSDSSQQARLLLVDPATGNVLARTDLFPGPVWGIAADATP